MLRLSKGLLGLCAFSLLVFLFGAQVSLAQTGTTSLRGAVLDKSGSSITGAKVTISNTDQGLQREAISGEGGQYEFPALTPGVYVLKVEMSGFRTYLQEKIQLLVNLPSTINVTLDV